MSTNLSGPFVSSFHTDIATGVNACFNYACTECRRSHKACSKERPCARCVRLGIPHLCLPAPRRSKNRNRNLPDSPPNTRAPPLPPFRSAPHLTCSIQPAPPSTNRSRFVSHPHVFPPGMMGPPPPPRYMQHPHTRPIPYPPPPPRSLHPNFMRRPGVLSHQPPPPPRPHPNAGNFVFVVYPQKHPRRTGRSSSFKIPEEANTRCVMNDWVLGDNAATPSYPRHSSAPLATLYGPAPVDSVPPPAPRRTSAPAVALVGRGRVRLPSFQTLMSRIDAQKALEEEEEEEHEIQ